MNTTEDGLIEIMEVEDVDQSSSPEQNELDKYQIDLKIGDVKSLKPSEKSLKSKKAMSLQRKGDRTTFLTRLGMTNKSLYEDYLAFKRKNIHKPKYTRNKIITPTKYKTVKEKPLNQSIDLPAVQISNSALLDTSTLLPNKSVLQEPVASKSITPVAEPNTSTVEVNISSKYAIPEAISMPNKTLPSEPSLDRTSLQFYKEKIQSLKSVDSSTLCSTDNKKQIISFPGNTNATGCSPSVATVMKQSVVSQKTVGYGVDSHIFLLPTSTSVPNILRKSKTLPNIVGKTATLPSTVVVNLKCPPTKNYSRSNVGSSSSPPLSNHTVRSNVVTSSSIPPPSNHTVRSNVVPSSSIPSPSNRIVRSNVVRSSSNPLVVDHMNPIVKLVRFNLGSKIQSNVEKAANLPAKPPIIVNTTNNTRAPGNVGRVQAPIIIKTKPQKNNLAEDKNNVGQYIKQIEETISALNGVISQPSTSSLNKTAQIENGVNSRVLSKIKRSNATQTALKTFRDKATMANNSTIARSFQKRLSRIKRKNDLLKDKVKELKRQLDTKLKPLYEQADAIEKRKKEGDTQAIFLMEQIQNFDKKRIAFSLESMTIYTVLYKRSLKGYSFLKHYNILGMPSGRTIRRFIEKDGSFQDKMWDEHYND